MPNFTHLTRAAQIGRRRTTRFVIAGVCMALAAGGAEVAYAATASPGSTATAATSVATSRAHNPHGSLMVAVQGRRVRIHGTATDPDSPAAVGVVISVPGRARTHLRAARPGHSYDTTLVLRYGRHLITARAVNLGAGSADPVLGSRTVTLVNPATRNPRGHVRMTRAGRLLTIHGVASDPDTPRGRVLVRVTRNGHRAAAAWTNPRTKRFVTRTRLPYGTSRIKVVAQNRARGTTNPRIGLRTVRVRRPWTDIYRGNKRIAARMFAQHRWTRAQMPALVKLWNRESGWHVTAANPSGAYGIPQALPGSKMGAFGGNWRGSATTQIRWGLHYIAGRYGSPKGAWAHSQAYGWY